MEPIAIETANLSKRYGKQIVAVDSLNLAPSSGAPGVAAVVGTSQAILVIAVYVGGFVLLSILLVLKRDVI